MVDTPSECLSNVTTGVVINCASLVFLSAGSEEIARVSPENPEAMPPLGPQTYAPSTAYFEDAASGAANATLAAWLASQNALPGDTGFYRVSQGREVGHDAIIELRVDDDGEVWSGGRACTVVRGAIDWP